MRRIFISLILLFTSIFALPALDLTLNGRNISVLDVEALSAFANSLDNSDASTLPLNYLFPWLSSVESLDVQSGANRVYWEAGSIDMETWYAAQMVRRDGVWEIHLGRDVFSAPDRIAVQGEIVDIDILHVWSAVNLPAVQERLETTLAFRDVRLDWQTVDDIENRLMNPPSSGLPHLVLYDTLRAYALIPLLTSERPVGQASFTTYSISDVGPVAIDAYNPEAALYFLTNRDSELFDDNGKGKVRLSAAVADGLAQTASLRSSGRLLATSTPLASLVDGYAGTAVLLPSSIETTANLPAATMTTVPGLPLYGGIPANLPESQSEEATLLFNALPEYQGEEIGVNQKPHAKLSRFYEAYERIARLAISGQMDVDEAIALMNEYINLDE